MGAIHFIRNSLINIGQKLCSILGWAVERSLYLRASPLSLFVQQVKAGVQRSIGGRCHVKCQELEFEIEKLRLWCYLHLPGFFLTVTHAVSKLSFGLKLKPLCTECLFGSRHWNPQMETGTPKTPSAWETRQCWRSASWIPYSAHSWSSDPGPQTCKLKSRSDTLPHNDTLISLNSPVNSVCTLDGRGGRPG